MNRDRIIVERLHGHWSAWYDGEPQMASGGATPAEAVDRLVGFPAGEEDAAAANEN